MYELQRLLYRHLQRNATSKRNHCGFAKIHIESLPETAGPKSV